jgi:hypothetical protein
MDYKSENPDDVASFVVGHLIGTWVNFQPKQLKSPLGYRVLIPLSLSQSLSSPNSRAEPYAIVWDRPLLQLADVDLT